MKQNHLSMGFSFTNHPFNLILLTTLIFFTSSTTSLEFTSLVYKGCAKQPLMDPSNVYSQTLSSLLDSLVAQSSKTKFFKTSSNTDPSSISGLFQCRGDLTSQDCYTCVSKLPQMLQSVCGNTAAGRIQLLGCYILYQPNNFPQISGFEMLYKTCSPSQVVGSGYQVRRDTAFAALERGILNGNGFYTASYESVYVLGQCEGDLSVGDCGECVKNAIKRAEVECGGSISGQIYLHKCFVSYSYYPNGVPRRSSSEGSRQNIGKTIAIVVGGAAGVIFGVMFLMCIRSLMRKKDDY